EHDGEQQRQRQPYPTVEDRHQQEQQQARDLLAARRDAKPEDAQADDQQPDRRQHERQREQPRQELARQQGIAVDRLRQHTGQRALGKLAVDRVKGERDRHQRHEERQEADKRRQRLLRGGEQPQEDERIIPRRLAQVLQRHVDRTDCRRQDEQF